MQMSKNNLLLKFFTFCLIIIKAKANESYIENIPYTCGELDENDDITSKVYYFYIQNRRNNKKQMLHFI